MQNPAPDSPACRRFRALARSAPWLSTSLKLCFEAAGPEQQILPPGPLFLLLRQREAVRIEDASGQPVYQAERFTADRSRQYVAATKRSWQLPAQLSTPVFTEQHLVLRRPQIQSFDGLLPASWLEAMLDPYELAGTEPAAWELAFSHPVLIHELDEVLHAGRPALRAVVSAGYSYQPAVPGFRLVPAAGQTVLVLDLATGICVLRQAAGELPLDLQVLEQDQYYLDSLFTAPAPTLSQVRSLASWEPGRQR